MRITLSLWDIGGQERFKFFKTDFFKGTAAVGLVFDLTRPETLDEINVYLEEIRERSGNIPIILVGNKSDLTKTVGTTVKRKQITQFINQHDLIDYIQTSALENVNVDVLFKTLAFLALFDLRPRLGEIVKNDHFRFKILLVGDASVGKSSLIKTFIENKFEEDYKLTVGLDLLVKDIIIPEEEIPNEAMDIIKGAIVSEKKRLKQIRRLEKISKVVAEETGNIELGEEEIITDKKLLNIYRSKKKKKIAAVITIIFFLIIIFLFLIYFLS
ncbi:MAG: GTP-binding protein [Promethearchaeota archaeon]|nr:MAG: GTP-binding protein [Candidatus Lokiarchaeota archaeon]